MLAASGVSVARVNGDDALRLNNSAATWNVTAERTASTLQDGKMVLVQFKLNSINATAPQAVLALESNDGGVYRRWGIYVQTDNSVQAQWNNGGGFASSALLGAGQFRRDKWYVLMLSTDNPDLVRLWERDTAPESTTMLRYQANQVTNSLNWKFKAYSNAGDLYLDTYHELKLLAESETQLAATGIALQAGWKPGGKLGVNGYWVRPTAQQSLIYNNDANFTGTRSELVYDSYGNVTQSTDKAWDGSAFTVYRQTLRGFYPTTSATRYLVGLPGFENRYACTNSSCSTNNLLASQWFVYDSNNWWHEAPADGKLTKVRTLVCTGNSSNQCVTSGADRYLYADGVYAYTAQGNVSSVTRYSGYGYFLYSGGSPVYASAGAQITNYTYDGDGYNTYKTGETNAAGYGPTWVYDYQMSVPIQGTDANNIVTTAEYDAFGRMVKVVRPGDTSASPTVLITYRMPGTSNSQPFVVEAAQKHSGGALTVRKVYNGLGWLLQQQTAGATVNAVNRDQIVDYQYNAYGQVLKQSAPYDVAVWNNSGSAYRSSQQFGTATTTSYDVYGRVTQVQSPTTAEKSTYSYPSDLATQVCDGLNHCTTTYNDLWGRVTEVRPPQDPWLRYSYDAADHLTKVEKMTSSSTVFAATQMNYDVGGRKYSMSDPDLGNWSYSYDALGNLKSQTDARPCTTSLLYDALNRLTQKSYSGTCGSATATVSYGYDATTPTGNKGKGQRTSMSDGSGSTTWVYGDNRGRLNYESKTISGGGTFVTTWAFDSGDQVTHMTYPDNETVSYTYRPQMTVNTVSGASSYIQETQYDAANRATLRTLGTNQLVTWYNYNAWATQGGRLKELRTGGPGDYATATPALQYFEYNYDAVGNLNWIKDYKADGGLQTQSFTYDTVDRLATAAASGGTGGTYTSETYSYDPNGRLFNGTGLGQYYFQDNAHKHAVTHLGGTAAANLKYTYDANGNMTQRVTASGTYNLTYDAESRLTGVSGAATGSFVYDGDGGRVRGVLNDQITNYVGNHYETQLGICSGQTPTGSTNWQAYGTNGIVLYVDTSSCGFAGTPLYLTSLGGNGGQWQTTGATSIYSPTPNGFQVYVRNSDSSALTPASANAAGWQINWIAVPKNLTSATLCSGQTALGNTNWQANGTNGITVSLDTSSCGFTGTPVYLTSLGGSYGHWQTTGATSIYTPSSTSFQVYVRNSDSSALTPATANTAGWHLNWIAIPQNLTTATLCSGQTPPGNTNWQAYNSDGITLGVSSATCNFTGTPRYFTSLGGNGGQWFTTGATSIYTPAPTSFQVYVRYSDSGPLTPAGANSVGWHINWIALNGNYYIVRKYYYAGNQRIAVRDGGNLRWLLGDHLGSTSYTASGTTESGEVRYKPFGTTRYSSGAVPTTYRYTGQREEAGLGLYYYGARWYDPALGRFIQPDTIVPNPADAQAFDRYAYVNNNPLKYNDPSGHCATLQNGSPDLTNDAGCWQAADEWLATFGSHGYDSVDDWRKYFASNSSMTEAILRSGLYHHWHPVFQQSRIYHPVYNPPPQMHEGPPPPSLAEAYKQMYLAPLLACAKAVSGACGVKGTGAAVGPGFGGQVGVNFYVDQNEAIGLYGVAGFGPAIALEGVAVGTSVAMEIIPNGNVFDIEGWGTELEASASYGKGVGVAVAGNIGLDGSGVLSISPQATTGFGAQAHWFITYASPIYQGK